MAKHFDIDIMCSNCGLRKTIPNNLDEIDKTVKEGWGSCGHALYCPECSRTWSERNPHPMADFKNTFTVIAAKFFREFERRNKNA